MIIIDFILQYALIEVVRYPFHDVLEKKWRLLLKLVYVVEEHQIHQSNLINAACLPEDNRFSFHSSQYASVLVEVAQH